MSKMTEEEHEFYLEYKNLDLKRILSQQKCWLAFIKEELKQYENEGLIKNINAAIYLNNMIKKETENIIKGIK